MCEFEATPRNRVLAEFRQRFGSGPDVVVQAPGRVNLIGGHTDYNDGFVLPMAIDRQTVIAARRRSDRAVAVTSETFADAAFDLASLTPESGWAEYLKGVAWAMGADDLPGWEGAIASSIPLGASLSSSAALELAASLVFTSLSGRIWNPVDAAAVAHRAEAEWVGVNSGKMDQLISACGQAGHVTLIDCQNLTQTHIAFPDSVRVVVLDTGTRRQLTTSDYNKRRQECEAAAEGFGVESLRKVAVEDLNRAPLGMDETVLARARHVVEENERTLAAARAMAAGDVELVGELITRSHVSLRDNFEVSSMALDAIVDAALAAPGCLGARMTGAGFAGCAIALVEEEKIDAFVQGTGERYDATALGVSDIFACRPSSGAGAMEGLQDD
jgi:galactokinase